MLVIHKKQLNKAYKKRFKTLSKTFFIESKQGIILFKEYLKYLRDSILLSTNDLENEVVKAKLATLDATVAELEAWLTINDEVKKEFHWNNFCELLKLNTKEWLAPNDSV